MRLVLALAATALVLGVLTPPVAADHLDLSRTPSDVWIREPGIRLDLGPEDAFHTPYVFRFPNGTLRMYYDVLSLAETRSAVSSDGLTWTKEPGVRIRDAGHPHMLALPDGTYRMYFEGFPTSPSIVIARSSDGFVWTREAMPLFPDPNARDPVVFELADGTYRMYFRSVLDLRSARSSDGLAWSIEAGVRVPQAREFAGVRTPDGTIILYYGQASPPFAAIWSARSSDGLMFSTDPGPRLEPGPPGALDGGRLLTTSILEFPDGTIRMYYQASPGPEINTQARVFSAVAERLAGTPCPHSQGFWKNYPEAWPVADLVLGNETYGRDDAIALLRTPTRGDASLILSKQLIAAKVNVANGSDDAPIAAELSEADALLGSLPGRLPYGVRPSSDSGARMTALAGTLDAYNNKLLTPDCGTTAGADGRPAGDGLPPTTIRPPLVGALWVTVAAIAIARVRVGRH